MDAFEFDEAKSQANLDKHWSAVVTYRDARIRLISVRRSRKKEVELYES
ncbi:BrnT family toxin [Acidithiobacillus sp. RW2]|uniref:BrnT family toxin n=1 Tax=Acidithiobacillus sulfurivorans TaxID=1958756 RepID=A0ABS6A5F6_9PROT|nr:BrnT family toxin [Acidithiobacillus sulfurivorans]